jgi:hypothetical protein
MYHTETCNAVIECVVPTNAPWTLRISDKWRWSQHMGEPGVYISDWTVRD